MAETSIIREFLVALGFKTDEAKLRNFESGIAKATKAVVGLATALEATAVAVAAAVAKWSSDLESLYFASQRVGASATNIKAFDIAAQNLGASADEAQGSLEGLAHALRVNPGNSALIEGLGVHLNDAHGRARDLTDVMADLGKVFARQPMYVAEQYSSMLGISERTMLALRNGDFAKQLERVRKELHENGFDKAARDAHDFMVSLRDLQATLEVFGAQVEDALAKKLGINIKQLNAWVQQHGKKLADTLVAGLMNIIQAAEWLAAKIEWLIGKLKTLDTETSGWSTKILGTVAALKLLGATELIGGVLNLAAAMTRLAGGIGAAGAASTGGALMRGLSRLGVIGALAVGGYEAYEHRDQIDAAFTQPGTDAQGNYQAPLVSRWLQSFIDWVEPPQQHVMRRLQEMGWSSAQAAGIVANLQAESGANIDPGTVGDHGRAVGIFQGDKSSQDLFRSQYGFDLLHASRDQQLEFLNWYLTAGPGKSEGARLRSLTGAGAVAREFTLGVENPADKMAKAAARARAAQEIAAAAANPAPFRLPSADQLGWGRSLTGWADSTFLQPVHPSVSRMGGTRSGGAPSSITIGGTQNTFHISGSGDPNRTARAVAEAQSGVNADLVRFAAATAQ